MRRDVLYTDNTKVKDLTVGELKDIVMECMLFSKSYPLPPLNCVGKEIEAKFDINTESIPRL